MTTAITNDKRLARSRLAAADCEKVLMDIHRRRLEVDEFLANLSARDQGVALTERQREFRLAVGSRLRLTAQMFQICRQEGRAMPADGDLPNSIFSCPNYNHQSFYECEQLPNDPWRLPSEFWRYALGLKLA